MVSLAGDALDADALGAVLDLPVLVSTAVDDHRRVAYLNPDHASAAGVPIGSLTPGAVWTVLRELPPGVGLVVDPGTDETLSFAPEEVNAVLGIDPGSDRSDASLLSRRRRAELATNWVLFHRGPDGRPLAPIVDQYDRRFAFAWTDQAAATETLAPGNSLVQVPLTIALRSNPDISIVLDPNSGAQVLIDAPLREEVLAASEFFPKGYLAFVAALTPEAQAPLDAGARALVATLAAQGIPTAGVWAVGYRLERARSQILLVVDARLDQPWSAVIPAVEAGMRGASFPPDQPVSAVSLAEIAPEFHELIRSTPNYAI